MDELMMDPMPEERQLDPDTPVTVVDVMFQSGGKVYFFDPDDLDIPTGADVIIDTARGVEFGNCVAGNHTIRAAEVVMPLRKVLRLATSDDKRTAAENREKEKTAFEICQQKIAEQALEMQLVSAEYAFDGSKLLFFFTADGRVDFRELVKSLAAVFHTRIELRQIGVRDKAKMVGGLGICGRPFCCSEFLDDFQPVSIKMAKVQNLSLNPTKISGTCGRLMCCLKYEQEAYEDLLRQCPRSESFVDTPDGRGTVTEVNLLRQSVKVRMEDHPEEINSYRNCDICVLRNGKGHKNDPPIPKEIAPISGNREHKPKLHSSAPVKEPKELTPDAPAQTPEPGIPHRRKRGEDRKPQEPTKKPQEATKKPQEPTKKPQEATKKPQEPTKKPQEATKKPQEPAKKPQEPAKKPEQQERRPQQKGKGRGPRSEAAKPDPRPEAEKSAKPPRPKVEKSAKPPRPEAEKSAKLPRPEAEEPDARPEGEKPAKQGKSSGRRHYYHR